MTLSAAFGCAGGDELPRFEPAADRVWCQRVTRGCLYADPESAECVVAGDWYEPSFAHRTTILNQPIEAEPGRHKPAAGAMSERMRGDFGPGTETCDDGGATTPEAACEASPS